MINWCKWFVWFAWVNKNNHTNDPIGPDGSPKPLSDEEQNTELEKWVKTQTQKEKPMENRLSKNFTLNELVKSQWAIRNDIDNTPTQEHYDNLVVLVTEFLQPLRTALKNPIRITSGYRSPDLNDAINGSEKSQHCKGQAVDFEITGMDNYSLAKYIADSGNFDQLILEFYTPGDLNSGWIHCSYKAQDNRQQILTAIKVDKKTKYFNGFEV